MDGTGKTLFLKTFLAIVAISSALPANAAVRRQPLDTQVPEVAMTAAECVGHIRAYRGAIGFLDARLAQSPAKLVYRTKSGEEVTVTNRLHSRLMQDRSLLDAGMKARSRACRQALSRGAKASS